MLDGLEVAHSDLGISNQHSSFAFAHRFWQRETSWLTGTDEMRWDELGQLETLSFAIIPAAFEEPYITSSMMYRSVHVSASWLIILSSIHLVSSSNKFCLFGRRNRSRCHHRLRLANAIGPEVSKKKRNACNKVKHKEREIETCRKRKQAEQANKNKIEEKKLFMVWRPRALNLIGSPAERPYVPRAARRVATAPPAPRK